MEQQFWMTRKCLTHYMLATKEGWTSQKRKRPRRKMETCRRDDSAHHRVTANGFSMTKYSNDRPGEVKYKNE